VGWNGNLFQEMERMQARINRLFDSSFPGGLSPAPPGEDFFSLEIRTDLRETEKEIIITCDLPGMDKNKIDLRIEDGNLVISGKRSSDQEKKGKGFYRRERSYGSFERVIALPGKVDESGIKATYEKGVLTVRLPKLKPSPVKSKKITVI
jgi:HSP20 family protein